MIACTVIIFVTVSCSRPDPTSHRFEVYDEDGVTVAHTTGGPLHDGPIFTVEPLLTLIENPSEPESMLFNPSAILAGEDGRYYVCDTGNGRVAVFGPEGNFERSKTSSPHQSAAMRYHWNGLLREPSCRAVFI